MKAHEALIAWSPGDTADDTITAGQVAVGVIPPAGASDWTLPFSCTGGAAAPAWRELRGDASKLALFLAFHEIVVRDGIDPQRAHEALLVIDEYAESIAPDVRAAHRAFFEERMLREIEQKTAWKNRIAACFGEIDVILANHPLDGKRARAAIRAAKYAEASRDDFEKEMVWHIYKEVTGEGALQPHIQKQVKTLHRLWDEVIPGYPDKPFEPAGLCWYLGPQGVVVERGLSGAKPVSAEPEPDLCAGATGACETPRYGFWSMFKRGIVGAFHKTSAKMFAALRR